jgi:hypothetical protein
VPPGLGNFSPGHDRANRWVLPALHRPPRNPPRSPCFPHLSWAHSLVGPPFRGANASTARHSSPNTHPEEFTPTVLLTMADHPLLAGKPQALRSMISSTREAVGDLKRGPSRSRGTRSTSCIRLSSYPQCQQFSVWRDVRTGPKPIHRGQHAEKRGRSGRDSPIKNARHLRHVTLRLVLVGVVPRAVWAEEPGVRERSQVLLGRGPREVIAASLDDEGGRAGSGESR